MLRIPVGPGALHLERYGHGGRAIVLIHGFATSSFLWRDIAPALALEGHMALAVDLLGYGESDRPIEGDYSIAAQAEYIDRAMAALRIQHATVVGVGIGGGIALRLAVMRPARVERLVLINSVGFDECPGRVVRAIQLGTARHALRVAQGVLGAAPLLRQVLEDSVARPESMPSRLVARYLAPYAGSEGVTHLLTLARALRADDVEELTLTTIAAPTLIVWGERETWLSETLPERLLRAIPESTVVYLPHAGHLVPEDAPARLRELLLEQLREVDTLDTQSQQQGTNSDRD
jgi:pimeloyl-ACP methyl ester carboxylesterase